MTIQAETAAPLSVKTSPCLACYPLGDTLAQDDEGNWTVRFIGLFESDAWQFRDQPTEGAYAHLEQYDFQVMVWEDEVLVVAHRGDETDAKKVRTRAFR